MNEMMERVARAIYDSMDDIDDGDFDVLVRVTGDDHWELKEVRNNARAAIEALKEPTEGMTKAGLNAVLGPRAHPLDLPSPTLVYPVEVWQAMINEALK